MPRVWRSLGKPGGPGEFVLGTLSTSGGVGLRQALSRCDRQLGCSRRDPHCVKSSIGRGAGAVMCHVPTQESQYFFIPRTRDARVDEAHRGIEDDRGIRHKKRLNYRWAATTLWVVSGATVVLGAFLFVIILGFGSLWWDVLLAVAGAGIGLLSSRVIVGIVPAYFLAYWLARRHRVRHLQ